MTNAEKFSEVFGGLLVDVVYGKNDYGFSKWKDSEFIDSVEDQCNEENVEES